MNALKDIIQRCHQRHKKPLRQRKTVVTPAVYKGFDYHFTVYCAHRHPVSLYDLEEADISFMPTGRTPTSDRLPQSFGGERFLTAQKMWDWESQQWHASWGIQVYTGIPSERDGARWHDLHFTYESICAAPDAVLTCIETLVNFVSKPLLVLTKSGGLRFSCRVPDYLHANTEEARFYIYKDVPIAGDDSYQREVYLEMLGEEGHSPWDNRYELILGDLLNPPVITKEVLFASIDALRAEIHAPEPLQTGRKKRTQPDSIVLMPSSNSHKLDLAQEALLQRGFFYLREENDSHHWSRTAGEDSDTDVLLSERDGIVWIRAATSAVELPMEDTPITDVWDDTGILPPIPATQLPVSANVAAIREGKLSPLAIKRPSLLLQKPEGAEKVYESLDKSANQIQRVFDSNTRVIGFVVETDTRNSYETESHLVKSGTVALSASFLIIEEAMGHFQRQNLPSIARWRHVLFLWDQVKEIPVADRMANPFQHGNVCEDPERFVALVEKGVDARETLCPECPVYTACQERGYLSQPATLQRAKTQIFGFNQTFLDPEELAVSEKLLEPLDGRERLCTISIGGMDGLFLRCGIFKNGLEGWRDNWQSSALGHFAQALLHTLEIETEPDNILTTRIRTVMQAFQQHEEELVKQMCQVNVKCRVIEQSAIDDETDAELARFMIEFESGVSAYIPLNDSAADKLTTKGLPIFRLESFVLNENMRIPMSTEQAIQLGILDIRTVDKIQDFPSVDRNPDWTLWHQLNRFFAHYTRDADAPMIWYGNSLQFWVPPVLHPSVKRLLITSAMLTERDLHNAFPDEEIEAVRIPPTPWLKGNRVFQIRTGTHTIKTLLNYDSTWDVIGLSKMGERFFLGICAEIDRDPSVKHLIITYAAITKQLRDLAEKENVCRVLTFEDVSRTFEDVSSIETAFEEAEVVWIVGTPHHEPGLVWRSAQILYGNDEEPMRYEADTEFQHYKDERVQRVYAQRIAEQITHIVGRVGLNRRGGKRVVLMSSVEIRDLTDRPETHLFDWEDFEVAAGLDKLPETIAHREKFEAERDQLTAETPREEVERILGCSSRQANRMLNKLRGGNIPRITFREQILSMLANGEKKAADIVAAIDGHPQAIHKELFRLTHLGEIEKVRWGVYTLPKKS